jgi:hypothetical protein
MTLIRLICFALVTLATPFVGNMAHAADAAPASAPAAAPAAAPVPTPDCGTAGVYVVVINSCVQFASATGWQVNLRTADVSRLAMLVGVAVIHQDSLRLGAGFYCGAGVALSGPNAGQCDLLFSVARFGALGFGTQVFQSAGRAVYQGLFTVALNLPGTQ